MAVETIRTQRTAIIDRNIAALPTLAAITSSAKTKGTTAIAATTTQRLRINSAEAIALRGDHARVHDRDIAADATRTAVTTILGCEGTARARAAEASRGLDKKSICVLGYGTERCIGLDREAATITVRGG